MGTTAVKMQPVTLEKNWICHTYRRNVCLFLYYLRKKKTTIFVWELLNNGLWTSDWPPEASTESATGAQVKAIHLYDWKWWSLAPPLLDPI